MLADVQKADRAETSASILSLFSENPDNFFSRFVTVECRRDLTSCWM